MNTLSIYKNESILNSRLPYNFRVERLPNNIRYFRDLAGLSQEKLGSRINRVKDTISKWERGEREISLKEAKLIAHELRVSLDDLAANTPPLSGTSRSDFDSDLMLQILQSMTKEADKLNLKIDREAAARVAKKIHNDVIESRKEGYELALEGLVFLNLKQLVA